VGGWPLRGHGAALPRARAARPGLRLPGLHARALLDGHEDEAHGREIGPEANEPMWDGAAMEYDDAVSGLVAG